MKTYQIFKDGKKIKDNVSPSELFNELPAGAIQISGDSKSCKWKLREGGHIEIVQNEEVV